MATKTKQPIIPDVKAVDSALVRPEGTAFNPMQDLQRSQIAAQNAGLPSGGFTPPTVPTTFNAGDLGKTQTPVVPPEVTAPAPDNTSAYLNGINTATQTADKIAQERRAALDKQFAPLDQQQQQITKNIQGIADNKVSSQQTYDTAFQKALQESGDPDVQKKLADLNIQIAQRNADYNSRIAALPGQGRGITTGIIAGQTDREKRMQLVEIGNLSTLKLAYQDNVNAAKDTAKQTVDFMFQDEERDLRNQQALLNANEGSYNRLEKKQADERQQIIQDRLDAIKNRKDELGEIQNLAIEAAKNKAPSDVAQKIAQAQTLDEALQIGAGFITPKEKMETQVVEVGNRKVLVNSQTGETIKDLGVADLGKKTSGGSGGGGGSVTISTPNGKDVKLSARTSAVYDNPALLANFTPTERGKILGELANAGLDLATFAVENLNAGQRDQIAQYDDLVRQGKEAEISLVEGKLNTGPIASRIQAGKALVGGAQDFTRYRSTIDNMGSALLKLRSGAAVTPQEFERIKGFIPSVNDDEKTAATKITKFYEELDTARINYIKRATQTEQQILDTAVKQDQTNLRTKYNY